MWFDLVYTFTVHIAGGEGIVHIAGSAAAYNGRPDRLVTNHLSIGHYIPFNPVV